MTTPQPPGVPERKTKHAKPYTIGCLIGLGIIVAGSVYLARNLRPEPSISPTLNSQEQRDQLNEFRPLVEEMQKTQIVTKIEEPAFNGSSTGRIWVSPSAWYGATFDQKRSMCYVLAKYCAAMIASRHLDCEIIDDHTGRRLVRFTDDGFSMN